MVTVGIDPHKKTHTATMLDEAGRKVGRVLTLKDDPDAVGKLTAWAARNPDNAGYLSAHTLDEIGRELAYLVDERGECMNERTRLINTMRWRLHELDPSLEPKSLTTLKAPRELAAALHTRAADTGAAAVLADVLARSCADLLRLTRRINDLDRDIAARTEKMVPTLLARFGVGPIVAATILAELGNPSRVRNAAAFARLNGTAPIPVWTGNNERHRLDRGGNRKLNHALHAVARTQARSYPDAQAVIAKHQHKKGTKGALRVLKRHLSDVIWRDLMTDITALTSQHTTS